MLECCRAAAGTGVEALLSPMEAAMVDELNAELRQTLRDYRCVCVCKYEQYNYKIFQAISSKQ
jgi:hypothetical protein